MAATSGVRRFSLEMYAASLVGSLPVMVMPIIILSRFGASQSAYWAVGMSMATLLYQLPGAIGQALLPEVTFRHTERRHLLGRAAMLTCVIMIPVLGIAYLAAPLGLEVFGRHYVAGALGVLHWLIIAGLITMLNYVTGTILYLAKKTFLIAVINVVDAVVVIGLATTWARDAQGAAISWAIGDVGNTLFFSLAALFAIHQVRGRWDELGGAAAPDLSTARPTMSSQQRALEALLELARLQGQGAFYNSSGVTEPLPRFTWEAYQAQEARRPRQAARQIRHEPDVPAQPGNRDRFPDGARSSRPARPRTPTRSSVQHRPPRREQ